MLKLFILMAQVQERLLLMLFASLNVVDLKVQDDLTVTDDAAIGGALTVTGIMKNR
jgi:hypothetical protein